MRYELKRFAREHFAHVEPRKEREHAAEGLLVERFFAGRTDGIFIEVGANEPHARSQTWHLEQLGWRGLLIEPIPELCDKLRDQRPRSTVIQAACAGPGHPPTAEFHVAEVSGQSTMRPGAANVGVAFDRVETVPVRTLDEILDEADLPRIDFMSIDVEGVQIDVLRGFSFARHRPRLLLIEDHLRDWRAHRFITAQGYRLTKRTGLNNWYIPADAPFTLTSPVERLMLWRKLVLGTPVRRIGYALRGGRCD